ncbi:MAG: hypoxanthine-guanine phosphoribosyltransferase [Betaproteobacteria bacterium]
MKFTADQARAVLNAADLVVSAEDARAAVERVAREVSGKLEDRHPLVLGVMRGSVVFAGHLLPLLRFPLEFDYLDVTRYRDTTRGGTIDWKVSPGTAVAGRVVLVLDDILDEGHTLAAIRDKLLAAGATEFYSAVFADKNIGAAKPIEADFVGVRLPNRYVFGFGMDVQGAWRNLPAVYALMDADKPDA